MRHYEKNVDISSCRVFSIEGKPEKQIARSYHYMCNTNATELYLIQKTILNNYLTYMLDADISELPKFPANP
jgi:hypothetical protein